MSNLPYNIIYCIIGFLLVVFLSYAFRRFNHNKENISDTKNKVSDMYDDNKSDICDMYISKDGNWIDIKKTND